MLYIIIPLILFTQILRTQRYILLNQSKSIIEKEIEMNVKNIDKQEKQTLTDRDKQRSRNSDTTPIRISSDLYELLREKAFYDRTTIRKVADVILDEALNGE